MRARKHEVIKEGQDAIDHCCDKCLRVWVDGAWDGRGRERCCGVASDPKTVPWRAVDQRPLAVLALVSWLPQCIQQLPLAVCGVFIGWRSLRVTQRGDGRRKEDAMRVLIWQRKVDALSTVWKYVELNTSSKRLLDCRSACWVPMGLIAGSGRPEGRGCF
jgi:hypothetical protein